MNIFKNQTILITGGTGSWGNELTKQLLILNPKRIIIYSRNEFNQVTMKRKFNNKKLKFHIGDVRDYDSLNQACKKVDYIFHLAALKHVPVCEQQPDEAIKTNINGTQNVIRAAINNHVKKAIDVSSDKACAPLNSYGMTKAVGEKLIINASELVDTTEFMCIRAGNVMGTAGSVIPLFIDQIKKNNKITITDKRMTRYFISLEEAISLLFTAINSNVDGSLFVMKMPACKLTDLAKVLVDYYGDNKTEIIETGIRPGEKIDEVLVSKDEVLDTYEYNDTYYLIYPQGKEKLNLKKVQFPEYSSSTYLLNKKEIKILLDKGGFLK